jgi:hypothetical protein
VVVSVRLSVLQGRSGGVRPSVCLAGQGQGCLSDKQSRTRVVTFAFPGRYLLVAQGRVGGSSVFRDLEFALRVSKTQKDLGNF